MKFPDLPILDVIDKLHNALLTDNNAVLVAPPGAGKTTLVPLSLLEANWCAGKKIIMLEPRRLAARSSAHYMASLLGEKTGETVGYRVRMDAKISAKTRIEVVTEGVFTRMIQDDPELSDIAAVLFDEFHERNLNSDFGLALAFDVQQALREDLRILVMSATIDGARIAKLINGTVVESEGRSYPVEILYHERPANERLEPYVVNEVLLALATHKGSILVFLPGQREIERIAEWLTERVADNVDITPLFGAMTGHGQDLAIKPAMEGRRKIVLATSIAETSLTIEGITIVIDCGLARLPHFEPASGLTRLETVRASRASIDQRAGRAGRTAPGITIRLWRREQTASLPAHAPPEILAADLSHLSLDLTAWGINDPKKLVWLDHPPLPAMNEAKNLLKSLGAFDGSGGLSSHGKALRSLSLPPRSANMLLMAASHGSLKKAALLSVILSERGLGGNSADLEQRSERTSRENGARARSAKKLIQRLTKSTRNLQSGSRNTTFGNDVSFGAILSFAWPERIAHRAGQSPSGNVRFRLANGSGAEIEADHALAQSTWLVVADIAGRAGAARILSAAAISLKEIEHLHHDQITTSEVVALDPQNGRVKASAIRKLGSLKLSEVLIANPDAALVEQALLTGIKKNGLQLLRWNEAENSLRQRLQFLHDQDAVNWPDVRDEALLARFDEWFSPIIAGKTRLDDISPALLDTGLKMLVPWEHQRSIKKLAPTYMELNENEKIQLKYKGGDVVLSARVQKFYGTIQHPSVMEGSVPILIELLSPAGRPVQITRDLPGFWQGSWSDVRADMRSRYPKHHWPENPTSADAKVRVKRRESKRK